MNKRKESSSSSSIDCIFGIDIGESYCSISTFENNRPVLLAKATYDKPLSYQNITIEEINFISLLDPDDINYNENYNSFITVLNWCKSILEKTFPEYKFNKFKCCLSIPSFLNSPSKINLNNESLSLFSIKEVFNNSGFEIIRSLDKCSAFALTDEITILSDCNILILEFGTNYLEALSLSPSHGAIEILSKSSSYLERDDIDLRKKTIANLINHVSNQGQVVVPSDKYDYVLINSASLDPDELKEIATSTKSTVKSITVLEDACAKGIAQQAAILDGKQKEVLLLDLASFNICFKQGNQSSYIYYKKETIPKKVSKLIVLDEKIKFLDIFLDFPIFKSNVLGSYNNKITRIDLESVFNKEFSSLFFELDIKTNGDLSLNFNKEKYIEDIKPKDQFKSNSELKNIKSLSKQSLASFPLFAFSLCFGGLILGSIFDYYNNKSNKVRSSFQSQNQFREKDSNSRPLGFNYSSSNFDENIPAGSTVSILSAIDNDANDNHTFSLIDGYNQSVGNKFFTIVGNKLKIKQSPDYEDKKDYTVVIQVTDSKGLSSEPKYMSLTVNNLNERSIPNNNVQSINADELFINAIKKYRDNDYYSAISGFQEVIRFDPSCYKCFYNIGLSRVNLKQYQAAILSFNKTIELNPNFLPAYRQRGQSKFILKNYNSAIKDLNYVISLNNKDISALNVRGYAYLMLEQPSNYCRDFSSSAFLGDKYGKENYQKFCE